MELLVLKLYQHASCSLISEKAYGAHVQCGLNNDFHFAAITCWLLLVRVTFVMTYYCIFVFSAKYFMGEGNK